MTVETAQSVLKRLPLQIWEKVLIIAGRGYEAGTYVGRIEDFTDGGLIVSAPEFISGSVLLREGMDVSVQVAREDALYEFETRISKETTSVPGQVWLASPQECQRVQRRLFVRVEWKDEIAYARIQGNEDWPLFPQCCIWYKASMHDISASGLRVSAVTNVAVGDRFLLRLPRMKGQGFPEYVFAVCRRSFTSGDGTHLGLEFVLEENHAELFGQQCAGVLPTATRGFTEATQNRLVVWIFQRQIDLRQKGLL
jgi:c-di-GMP-binding flagellar brake protein YcgR